MSCVRRCRLGLVFLSLAAGFVPLGQARADTTSASPAPALGAAPGGPTLGALQRAKVRIEKLRALVAQLVEKSLGGRGGERNENDLLAGQVLLGIQHDVNRMGDLIDQAIDAQKAGDPGYTNLVHQTCGLALGAASQATHGRSLADMLPKGVLVGSDFDLVAQEAQGVETDLGC